MESSVDTSLLDDPYYARAMSNSPVRRTQSEPIITPVAPQDRPIVTIQVEPEVSPLTLPQPEFLSVANSYGLDPEVRENRCCPTCGVYDTFAGRGHLHWEHKICLPSIGPAKPRRIQDVFGSEMGNNLHFDMAEMSEQERVATGGNIFRCQTVCTGNCALCFQPCQEQGPAQWRQFTGWDWCCNYCWKDLCWRYHTEYLEPNNHVNTLGRFLVFLEE